METLAEDEKLKSNYEWAIVPFGQRTFPESTITLPWLQYSIEPFFMIDHLIIICRSIESQQQDKGLIA
jgi:hypothetical protein